MDKDIKTGAQNLPAVAGQVEFGVRPRAWYVERIAPGKRDNGMKLGPWWKQEQAEEWTDDRHELRTLYDQAAIDAAVAGGRDYEASRWQRRIDGLERQLREVDARYMALLKAVADGRAVQPTTKGNL